MENKTQQCPRCHQSTSGKFCSHCGLLLGARASGNQMVTYVPWISLALSLAAFGFSLVVWFDRGASRTPPDTAASSEAAAAAFNGGARAVDLSSMSPREAADRLFNRVMAASENGATDEANRFAPMALQAYLQAGTLDKDAHYHVALIHLVTGNIAGAREQIARLREGSPNHLMAHMLEHEIAKKSGNTANATRAAKQFLAAYDAEMSLTRTEYQEHRSGIERFQKLAAAAR